MAPAIVDLPPELLERVLALADFHPLQLARLAATCRALAAACRAYVAALPLAPLPGYSAWDLYGVRQARKRAADVPHEGDDGQLWRALWRALRTFDEKSLLQVVRDRARDGDVLTVAATTGDVFGAELLLKAGVPPDGPPGDLQRGVIPPLVLFVRHFTCPWRDPEGEPSTYLRMVRAFVRAGATVNYAFENDSSLLADAVERLGVLGEDVVVELLEAGADPQNFDAYAPYSIPPLHWAMIHDASPELVARIAEAGADVNWRVASGQTPIEIAIGMHNTADRGHARALVEALLRAGADAGPAMRMLVHLAPLSPELEDVKRVLVAHGMPEYVMKHHTF
jgi:hypothetical protein